MWCCNELFRVLESLCSCDNDHVRELLTSFEVGDNLIRGFADVGYEEFVLLPSNRLCSKLSGVVKPLDESEMRHFFRIPSLYDWGDLICRLGGTNLNLGTELGSRWRASVEVGQERQPLSVDGKAADVCLAKLVLLLAGVQCPTAPRLRVSVE
jgi:hypothetical protein